MAPAVIDVLRRFLPAHLEARSPLSGDQRRAIRAILHCRTPAMGGHRHVCEPCGQSAFVWHSCNHKACPQCGRDATRKWVERELGKRVNAPYFMATFTLPSQLRGLFFGPLAKEAYDLFFSAASRALREKLALRKHLGAAVSGFTGVLHTWNQQLHFHPHIHFLVPGVGIDARGRVARVKKEDYLVHVPTLRKAFRHHFRLGLEAKGWEVDPVTRTLDWGVDIRPFGSGSNALKYLGAYVKRIAIGDRRIVSLDDHSVTFTWKDRQDGGKTKLQTLSGDKFVKRYLRHVTPRRMHTIRYYGFCHPAAKRNRQRIRFHTGLPLDFGASAPTEKEPDRAAGFPLCPECQKAMKRAGTFPAVWSARGPP